MVTNVTYNDAGINANSVTDAIGSFILTANCSDSSWESAMTSFEITIFPAYYINFYFNGTEYNDSVKLEYETYYNLTVALFDNKGDVSTSSIPSSFYITGDPHYGGNHSFTDVQGYYWTAGPQQQQNISNYFPDYSFYEENANFSGCSGTWDGTNTCAKAIDGDWTTYGRASTPVEDAFLDLNYTKENNSINLIWEVYPGEDGEIHNFSIPDSCFGFYSDKVELRFRGIWNVPDTMFRSSYFCKNSSGFSLLGNYSGTAGGLYEEGVTWGVAALKDESSSQIIKIDGANWTVIYPTIYDTNWYDMLTARINVSSDSDVEGLIIDVGDDGTLDVVLPGTLHPEGNVLEQSKFSDGTSNGSWSFLEGGVYIQYINYTFFDPGGLVIQNISFQISGVVANPLNETFYWFYHNNSLDISDGLTQVPTWVYDDFDRGRLEDRWTKTSGGSYTVEDGEFVGLDGTCSIDDTGFDCQTGGPNLYAFTGNCDSIRTTSMDLELTGGSRISVGLKAEVSSDTSGEDCRSSLNEVEVWAGYSKNSGVCIPVTTKVMASCTPLPWGSCSDTSVNNDTIMAMFNPDAGTVDFYRNNGTLLAVSDTYTFSDTFEWCSGGYADSHYAISLSGNVDVWFYDPMEIYGIKGEDKGNFSVGKVDYNTSAIFKAEAEDVNFSSAKTTLMGTGGDIDLYISANNGTDWEIFTSGQNHIFQNPGPEIRLRFVGTSNASDPNGVYEDNSSNMKDSLVILLWTVEVSQGFTSNISIDIGADGTDDYTYSEELNSSDTANVELNDTVITSWLGVNCFPGDNCLLPIEVSTDTPGVISFGNISANATLNYIDLVKYYSPLETLWGSLKNLVLKFMSRTEVDLTVKDINFTYVADRNYTITGYNPYGGANNITVFVRHSPFNLTYPEGIDVWEIIPSSLTEANITPYGQVINNTFLDSTPIFNITSLAKTDGLDLFVSLNESIDNCVNITLANSLYKFGGIILNITEQELVTNLSIDYNSTGCFMWVDLSGCVYDNLIYFEPTIVWNSLCTDCLYV